jgi:Transcriptional regulators of sugar metabolism
MLANQRRERICQLINEDGHASVTQLSKLFKVTEVTIRQDLIQLEKEGLLQREHGGAHVVKFDSFARNISLPDRGHTEEKIAIAKKAAEYVNEGDTIILDSGSSITELAKLLVDFNNLTVITNALNIALILGVNPNINLEVTGGEFKAPTLSLTGEHAGAFLKGVHVDKVFLATAGISLKSGLTYPSISDICVKRAMIESGDEIFVLADSSKIGSSSFASLGAMSLISHIITDKEISKEKLNQFKEFEVDFIIAD